MLKSSFIILLPIIGLVILLSYTNYLDYEKPLTYDKVDKITFKNFREIELFKKSLYAMKDLHMYIPQLKLNLNLIVY